MTIQRALAIFLFAAPLAAGCSRSEPSRGAAGDVPAMAKPAASSSPKAAPLKLIAVQVPALCTVDWTVARDKGFFAAEGLDVDLRMLDTSDAHAHEPGVQWVTTPAGPVKADLTFIEHSQLVAVATGALDYYVVAGEHSGCHQLVVPVRSPIQTMADLKGKRIGIPANHDIGMWQYLARQAGVPPDSLQWVYPQFGPGGSQELDYVRREFKTGGIDAFVTTDPVGEVLKEEGVARLVASNTWTSPLNGWYCCMVGVRRGVLDTHPGVARAVTRAIRQSAAFVERYPAEAVALGVAAGHLSPTTPQDLSARLLGQYVWTATGRIQEDLERYFQLFIEGGKLPATVSPRDLVKRVYRSGE